MTRRKILAAVALGAFGAAAVACSLLVPLNDVQCSTDADCTARGAGFAGAACVSNVCVRGSAEAGDDGGSPEAAADADAAPEATVDAGGPWGCLQVPPDPSDPSATIDVQILVFDAFQTYTLGGSVDGGNDLQVIQATPVPGVTVAPCQPLDPTCEAGAPLAVTNDAGIVDLSLNGAFDGYYLLEQSGAFPELFYPGRLLAVEPHTMLPTSLLKYALAEALGGQIGVSVNESTDAGPGHIFTLAFDCTDRHAAGVSYSLSVEAGTQFYQQNMLPTTSATQTDTAGVGGFLNVPSGIVQVTATVVTENNLALPPYSVYVRPGGQTLVYFRPKSRPVQ